MKIATKTKSKKRTKPGTQTHWHQLGVFRLSNNYRSICHSGIVIIGKNNNNNNNLQYWSLDFIFVNFHFRPPPSISAVKMQRRMSITIREYKFFRSFSQKFENWPKRKAEALWRKMRERKIAGEYLEKILFNFNVNFCRQTIFFLTSTWKYLDFGAITNFSRILLPNNSTFIVQGEIKKLHKSKKFQK